MGAGDSGYFSLIDGFASALQDGLDDPSKSLQGESTSGDAATTTSAEDSNRASLVMDLLLHAAMHPGPNFAHLLLGYSTTDGLQGNQTP